MARVVLLVAVLTTSLVGCQPQFQQFFPPGRQQQFQQFSPPGRQQQFQQFSPQGRQLSRLQGSRVKFGDRTSRAQNLCSDFSNCQFGYTFNTAELETDSGESVNTQFSVDALDQLPPLSSRPSQPRLSSRPQQNIQLPLEPRRSGPQQNALPAFSSISSVTQQKAQTPPPLKRFEPQQNTLPDFPSLRSGTPPKVQSPPPSRRFKIQQNNLPVFPFVKSQFPQFDLPSSKFGLSFPKFDLSFPQFDLSSQPGLSLNSVLHDPVRKTQPRRTTPSPTTIPTTTKQPTTTSTNINEYDDSSYDYYYEQYEESFSLQDDDVRDELTDFYPVTNDDYEYDYQGNTCPGSLEECINVCIPLEDIYVYSICVKECADRCN